MYYNIEISLEFGKRAKRAAIAYSSLWLAAIPFTYLYIHSYAVIIPAWFVLQSIASQISAQKYLNTIVKSITLEQDKLNCIIEFGNQKQIKVKITDNDIVDIKEVIPQDKKYEEINKKYRESQYVILFDSISNDTHYEQLRLMILDGQCSVSNFALLRDLVSGEDVSVYQYVEEAKSDKTDKTQNTETDEELTKRLKEELNV